MKKVLLFLAVALMGMAANAQTVWSEDFENVTVNDNGIGSMPTGWTLYEDNLTNFNNGNYDYRGYGNSWCVNEFGWQGKSAFCMTYTNEGTACDRWMITPAITLPSTGEYSLFFDAFASQYDENISVLLSTTGTEKTDFTETLMATAVLPAGENHKLFSLSAYAGETVYIAFRNTTADGLYTMIDNISVAVFPENAIACNGVDVPSNVPQDNNFNVEVTVTNRGTAPLTSFTLEYSLNGGSEQTINVNNINVAPFASYTYTFSLSSSELGANNLSVTVSAPNGETDVDASDNTASTTMTVYDPSTVAQRTTVMEHFTTARCPNCPAGHDRLDAAVAGQEDRVVWIAHHVGYYTDDMTINESNQMLSFFNDGGSTFAPAWMLDRNFDFVDNKSQYPGPAFFPGTNARQILTNAINSPALVNVNISDLNYNAESRTVSFTVSGEFLSEMTFTSPRLTAYILEDGIKGAQSGATGIYTHNHVLRACISNVWGDEGVITSTAAGSTFSKTYTFHVSETWRPNNCWVAAFVNDYGTDVMHRTIANGAKSGYLTNVAIEDVENTSISMNTYPNPATEMAVIEAGSTIRSYQMVDALGRVVMQSENLNATALELDVRALAQGVYFINVTTDNGVASQRLTIVK
ncbi:MAG: Omp28-related outer membrane protein [Bacteroidales bacterium]|nr:Omp28-related outer membrane protein [Bacteroidales bacterium]